MATSRAMSIAAVGPGSPARTRAGRAKIATTAVTPFDERANAHAVRERRHTP